MCAPSGRPTWDGSRCARRPSSTPSIPSAAWTELVDLAGADAVVDRARAKLEAAEPVVAIHLAEAVLRHQPGHAGAVDVMIDAHRALLDGGGDVSFWESGWLRHQVANWESERRK